MPKELSPEYVMAAGLRTHMSAEAQKAEFLKSSRTPLLDFEIFAPPSVLGFTEPLAPYEREVMAGLAALQETFDKKTNAEIITGLGLIYLNHVVLLSNTPGKNMFTIMSQKYDVRDEPTRDLYYSTLVGIYEDGKKHRITIVNMSISNTNADGLNDIYFDLVEPEPIQIASMSNIADEVSRTFFSHM